MHTPALAQGRARGLACQRRREAGAQLQVAPVRDVLHRRHAGDGPGVVAAEEAGQVARVVDAAVVHGRADGVGDERGAGEDVGKISAASVVSQLNVTVPELPAGASMVQTQLT